MRAKRLWALAAWLFLGVFFTACTENGRKDELSPEILQEYDSIQTRGFDLLSAKDSLAFWSFLDSVEKRATTEKSEYLRLRTFQLRQVYLERAGQLEKALAITEEVLLATEGREDLDQIRLESLFNKGNLSFQLGQYQTAFQSYFKARKLIAAPDSCDLGYYDYCLAMVAYQQKNFKAARDLFIQADKFYLGCPVKLSTSFRRQEIISNIGLCYLNLNQPDSAIYYYTKSRNFILHTLTHSAEEKEMYRGALAVLSGNIGVALARKGDLEAAKTAILEELRVNLERASDRGHLVYSVNELCEVLFQQEKLDEMYSYLMLLDSLPELRRNTFPSYRFYHHMAQYYVRKGQQQKAVVYVDSFVSQYEFLRKADRDLYRTDLDRSMRILESEYQLKQSNQLASQNIQRNTYTLVLLFAVLLLFIIVFIALLNGRKNNRILEKLNKEKDKMLRVVAHDLRNPIAAIYSLSELKLSDQPPVVDAEDWRLVGQACSGSLKLIQEMLEVTEMENISQRGLLESVSINLLCSDAVRLIQYRADEKGVKLLFKGLPVDKQVEVMPERMRRAITNLLTNAIKFSSAGTTVSLQVELNEKGVLISVQDQGIGIPVGYKDKIFESFTSARRDGTAGERAYGLGLSIVREIVEAHQGKVWYISSEGKGSTFFIQLRIAG